jgi:NADPH:quinone reductase-like Zn-dependent oxidoreductase
MEKRAPVRRVRRILARVAAVIAVLMFSGCMVAWFRSTNACYDGTRAVPKEGMQAIVYCDYGSPEVLKLETIEKPTPGDSSVLVRVRAAAVNPLDWHYMRGEPRLMRLGEGFRRPKEIRLGVDFAGTIESVGKAVTQFKPGDEVFGARTGAFGQYITVRATMVTSKPGNVGFEEAAAIPVSALTALQALRDHGKVGPGQKVLINGASGGVGTFAVQIAKALGAEVTGVCSSRNVELVRSLGADHVIDYTKEDFTKSDTRYDVIIDNVGNHPVADLRRMLPPDGRYVMVGGPSGGWIDPFPRVLTLIVTGWFVDQDLSFFISRLSGEDLALLREMIEAGQITPVIDRRYTLAEVPKAIEYLETGRARGKVVITIP